MKTVNKKRPSKGASVTTSSDDNHSTITVQTIAGKFKFPGTIPPALPAEVAGRDYRIHLPYEVKKTCPAHMLAVLNVGGLTIVSWADGSVCAIRELASKTTGEIYDAYLLARWRLETVFSNECARRVA